MCQTSDCDSRVFGSRVDGGLRRNRDTKSMFSNRLSVASILMLSFAE